MQPALRVDFGTLFCCMLRHLFFFVLCIFSCLPRWHFRPPFLSLGALLFELSDVIFASGTSYCHAVCILPRFWLTLCFYVVAQVQLNPGKPFKCLESGCSSACFPGQVLALSVTGATTQMGGNLLCIFQSLTSRTYAVRPHEDATG